MDVGCSGNLETYSIIENADYSYIELSCELVSSDVSIEAFEAINNEIKGHTVKPIIWDNLISNDIDINEYDINGGYVKKYLKNIFSRIEELGAEYVVFDNNTQLLKENGPAYIDTLNDIATVAGSYGLEIIVLVSGTDNYDLIYNYEKIRSLEIDHPFLKYGIDLHNIEDYDDLFESLMDGINLFYYRLPSVDNDRYSFSDNIKDLTNKLADVDCKITIWSRLGELAAKIIDPMKLID